MARTVLPVPVLRQIIDALTKSAPSGVARFLKEHPGLRYSELGGPYWEDAPTIFGGRDFAHALDLFRLTGGYRRLWEQFARQGVADKDIPNYIESWIQAQRSHGWPSLWHVAKTKA